MESHEASSSLGLFINPADPVGGSCAPALLILVADGVVHAVGLLALGDDVVNVSPFAVPGKIFMD